MESVKVNSSMANQRIEKFLRKYLSEVPLSTIYKLIRQKDIKVNGVRVNKDYVVKENDLVEIYIVKTIEKNENEEVKKTGKHFNIVYEDENVIFVNKQVGILVQQDINNSITLTEEVLYYLYQKGEYNPTTNQGFKPSPAHRIDRNTCGLVMFGKSVEALNILSELIKNREGVTKKYRALVFNHVLNDGEVNLNIIKDATNSKVKVVSYETDEGLSAKTEYHVIDYYQNTTLLDVTIHSGRTHQIRAHMAAIGYPLVGDTKYGDFKLNKEFEKKYQFKNQFLQAYYLSFNKVHGLLSYLSNRKFIIKLENEYEQLLNRMRKD